MGLEAGTFRVEVREHAHVQTVGPRARARGVQGEGLEAGTSHVHAHTRARARDNTHIPNKQTDEYLPEAFDSHPMILNPSLEALKDPLRPF